MENASLHHVALHTRDMDRSIQFYRSLGATVMTTDKVVKGDGWWQLALIKWHDLVLELKTPDYAKSMELSDSGFFNHICLEVQDVDQAIEELKGKGIDTWLSKEPNVFGAYGGLKNIFFRGPDGEQIELLEYCPAK